MVDQLVAIQAVRDEQRLFDFLFRQNINTAIPEKVLAEKIVKVGGFLLDRIRQNQEDLIAVCAIPKRSEKTMVAARQNNTELPLDSDYCGFINKVQFVIDKIDVIEHFTGLRWNGFFVRQLFGKTGLPFSGGFAFLNTPATSRNPSEMKNTNTQ